MLNLFCLFVILCKEVIIILWFYQTECSLRISNPDLMSVIFILISSSLFKKCKRLTVKLRNRYNFDTNQKLSSNIRIVGLLPMNLLRIYVTLMFLFLGLGLGLRVRLFFILIFLLFLFYYVDNYVDLVEGVLIFVAEF